MSACTLVLFLAMLGSVAPADDSRPNIIFLLTDDQRADSLGCYGNSVVQTSEIDRLAAEGVLFENAFVTSAICTPSRACYFLGQYERRHGVNFNSGTALAEAAWQQSYPVRLRQAGYFTGYVGKNHVPIGSQGYASGIIERSFDFWYAAHGHLMFYPKERHKIFQAAHATTQVEILEEGALSFLGSSNGSFIAGAESFLQRRPADRPFCLTIAFNVPHADSTSRMKLLPSDPEIYRTLYRDRVDSLPLPNHYTPKALIQSPRLPPEVLFTQYRQTSYDYVDTESDLRERLVREWETVTGIDRLLGDVRKKLAELNLDGNTVLVLASDHGVMHGEFGLGGKALNYEPCLRIPMIFLDPRLPRPSGGRRLTQLVQSIDVAPTFLDLAGEAPAGSMQGQSLLPLLRGADAPWRTAVFAENLWSTYFGNPRVESVRTREWKYIRYFATDRQLFPDGKGKAAYAVTPQQAAAYESWLTASIQGLKPDYEELFHISIDPDETINLAGDAKHQTQLRQMRDECDRQVREAKGDVGARPLTVRLESKEN